MWEQLYDNVDDCGPSAARGKDEQWQSHPLQ